MSSFLCLLYSSWAYYWTYRGGSVPIQVGRTNLCSHKPKLKQTENLNFSTMFCVNLELVSRRPSHGPSHQYSALLSSWTQLLQLDVGKVADHIGKNVAFRITNFVDKLLSNSCPGDQPSRLLWFGQNKFPITTALYNGEPYVLPIITSNYWTNNKFSPWLLFSPAIYFIPVSEYSTSCLSSTFYQVPCKTAHTCKKINANWHTLSKYTHP